MLPYMGCHAGTALPLPGSCPQMYTVHLRTGTSEIYIGSQPDTSGGGFVYYGPTHYTNRGWGVCRWEATRGSKATRGQGVRWWVATHGGRATRGWVMWGLVGVG